MDSKIKDLKKFITEISYGNNLIKVRITPNSSKNEITGVMKTTENNRQVNVLKIKINSPPEDNKANTELIKFFKKFGIQAQIIKGQKSREKVIKIEN